MEYERKCTTITWLLDNVKYIRRMDIYSPVIFLDEMDGTKWQLGIVLITASKLLLSIKREAEDNGPKELGLHYQFSVKTLQGTFSNQKKIHTFSFQKSQKCPEVIMDITEMQEPKHSTVLNLGNITIRSKLWRQQESILKSHEILAQTRMRMEHSTFVGVVENFSDFYGDEMVTLKTLSSSTGERIMTVKLLFFYPSSIQVAMFRQVKIKIIFIKETDNQPGIFCDFKLFILDNSDNKTDTGKLESKFVLKSVAELILPGLWQEELIENSDRYLLNDSLSLHCELTFCSGIEYEKVEISEYETTGKKESDFANAVEALTSKESILCDTRLQTATETFPAHTTILSAKSPVFEAMFNASMKETIQKCVHIDDVDAETVKHMLVFLYDDNMEELKWQDTIKLYFAADKYQILSLKEKCSALLKKSIDLSNCCVLLLVADLHQDKDLKHAMRDFIKDYGKEIIYCDQWKDLENNHPKVVIEILRDIIMRRCFMDLF